MSDLPEVKVWDPLVRFFHWSLVTAFFIAYFTEDDWMTVHSWAGYLIAGLLAIRLVWGVIGTRYARFNEFIYRPKHVIGFAKDSMRFKAKRYLGHNPAGGAMIIALLISLIIISLSGMMLIAIEEQSGPFASWFVQIGGFWPDIIEETHEFFAEFIMILVLIHVAGVIIESFIHNENLVKSMLTGFKPLKNNQLEKKQ